MDEQVFIMIGILYIIITGAVGSSVLAYILPCLFHLKLCWHDISVFVKTKDIAIVIFGLVASLISAYTVVQEIVQNTKV